VSEPASQQQPPSAMRCGGHVTTWPRCQPRLRLKPLPHLAVERHAPTPLLCAGWRLVVVDRT
jgi:hypothetical protein